MDKNTILIVESPGKCKKIESLTGMKCIASYGHIMDIPSNIKWFDPNDISPPYDVTNEKKKVVSDIKKIVGAKKEKRRVLIAADMDREGEAISENLMRVLKLDTSKAERIRFNQITGPALKAAIDNPGVLDKNLFHAQQARRVLDILYGFIVSPILWSHIQKGLSAGRCQSPAVRLCLERQREQEPGDKFHKSTGKLQINDEEEIDIIRKDKLNTIQTQDISKWVDAITESKNMIVKDIKKSVKKTSPPPPCITSSLQQEAYKRFGIHPDQCMKSAQKLYEQGYITYMRTDSIELSPEFRKDAENFIKNKFGDKYYKGKIYGSKPKTKVKSQEAHEAIRPIKVDKLPETFEMMDKKIFSIIWTRAVASQMSAAEYDELTITFVPLNIQNTKTELWISNNRKLKFDGYLILKSPFGSDVVEKTQNKKELPQLNIGDQYEILQIMVRECVEAPPSPYSPADFIKTLEKTGIGRPSTFSAIIDKIKRRGYVSIGQNKSFDQELKEYNWNSKRRECIEKNYMQKLGGQKNVFLVSPLGESVTEFLENSCPIIIETNFTAKLEESLDLIAQGNLEWKSFISKFYNELKSTTNAIAPPTQTEIRTINWLKKFTDLFNGKELGVVQTKNGQALALVLDSKIEKYGSLPPKTNYNKITFEDAKDLIELPKIVGEFNNNNVELNIGRYGWYVKIDNKNVSLGNKKDIPNWDEIKAVLSNDSSKTKNTKIKEVSKIWSIWHNPTKNNHFIMKRTEKGKISFHGLPTYKSDTKYTDKMCEEIAKATKKK
tara:strand:+ start:18170 stop:20503 length:2334 start_codon:yes stop_codon:yes gene_type:complete